MQVNPPKHHQMLTHQGIESARFFFILIYRLSNFILTETIEPRGDEGDIPTSEPSLPTKSQEMISSMVMMQFQIRWLVSGFYYILNFVD